MSFRLPALVTAVAALAASLVVAIPVQSSAATTGLITGTITKAPDGGSTASSIEVELWAVGSRNRDRLVATVDATGGKFSFRVAMGARNAPSALYKLHIIGRVDGVRRSWWWRGNGNGGFAGGSRESNMASGVRVTSGLKYTFTANAKYSAIRGTVLAGSTPVRGTEVTVVGRPPYWSTSSKVLRDHDIMGCANVYGRDTTDSAGRYEVGFLPVSGYGTYAVKAAGSRWNNRWGTCHAAVNYRRDRVSTPRMIALSGSAVTADLNTAAGRTAVSVAVRGYLGPASTARVDRFLTVREYAPGRSILASDVVAATTGRSLSLGEGYYWFEVGRRTGCAAWYKSRYRNNNGYFNGLDRSFERWKARGFRMYRQHCRAYSSGTYRLVYVGGPSTRVVLTNSKGGWVTGKVTNAKIKPRTELMVRLTSSDGRKVYRTVLTDGAGRFKLTGLASGRYRIVVNADSWRGISRAFTGKKTVTVSLGRGTSVGTLRFKQ